MSSLDMEIILRGRKFIPSFWICSTNCGLTTTPKDGLGLNTLKFQSFDHIVLDTENFGSILVLSASPYEQYNFRIKKAHGSTWTRIMTRTEETVSLFRSVLNREKTDTAVSSIEVSRRIRV